MAGRHRHHRVDGADSIGNLWPGSQSDIQRDGVVHVGQTLLVPIPLRSRYFVIFVAAVEVSVRSAEEPYLLRIHGDEYRDYMASVGRFFPGIGLRPLRTRSHPLNGLMNQVDRRKSHPPRQPLPCRARADERHHGASSTAVAARNQFKCCVCDDYPRSLRSAGTL